MSGSRSVSILSWADEVEKEEQEEAGAQALLLHQTKTQKPNPFGSARPREVVLQERGIDWRIIDQGLLQPPSSNRINKHSNEKPQRERSMEQIPALPLLVSHCTQTPLSFAPKNGILKWMEKPCVSPNIRRGRSNRFEPEKENVFHQHRLQRDHCNAKSSDPRTHKGPPLNLRQQNRVPHGDNERKSDKTGECSTRAKRGQHKRRRRHSVASIKDGTVSSVEHIDSRLPSCILAANELNKMKQSEESQKLTALAANKCGRVGRTGFGHQCRKRRNGTTNQEN